MKKLGIFFEKVYLNCSSAKEKFTKAKGITKIYSSFKLVFWYLTVLILLPFCFLYEFYVFVSEIENDYFNSTH